MKQQTSETNLTIEQEIHKIFSTISGQQQLPETATKRVCQLLKAHLQDTVTQALHRGMWRDPTSAVLDQRDILHVIAKGDYKYKNKVGLALPKMNLYKRATETGQNLKQYKEEEMRGEDEGSDSEQEIEKYVMEDKNIS